MSNTPAPGSAPAFRLAFRAEADFVNAYYAPPATMDGAILVSSMRRRMLDDDPVLWDDWKTLIRLAFERHMARLGLTAPHEWNETPAPEHERTKPGEAMSNWIQTMTGKKFTPFDPRPEDITIIDIAHALSNLCRFTGHCRFFYSVAEHSVRVSWHVPREDAMWGLLHDASEAYLHDLPRPIKRHAGLAFYREQERRLQGVICATFGLAIEEPQSVGIADSRMLMTERRDLMTRAPEPWAETDEPYAERIRRPWLPRDAHREFRDRYDELVRLGGFNPPMAAVAQPDGHP